MDYFRFALWTVATLFLTAGTLYLRFTFREWQKADFASVLDRVSAAYQYANVGELCYFIVTSDRKHVKIGYTSDLRSRVQSIQTGCPYHVVVAAALPGGEVSESILHMRFAKHRKIREWFYFRGELRSFLDYVLDSDEYVSSNKQIAEPTAKKSKYSFDSDDLSPLWDSGSEDGDGSFVQLDDWVTA